MDGSKMFGFKQDILLEEVTEVIQDFLINRKEIWDKLTGEDFFSSHPHKKWGTIDKKKIEEKDIRQWDATLCIKWLLEFQWDRIIPNHNIGNVETNAIHTLRQFRNNIQHRGIKRDDVTETDFSEDCIQVRGALVELGFQEKVEEIIRKASEAKFGDDIRWEYETVSILGSGSFGIVLQARNELDDQLYAVKLIPYRETDTQMQVIEKHKMKKEAKFLAKMSHSNIVSYKHSGEFGFTVDLLKRIILWGPGNDKIASHTKGLLIDCFDRAEISSEKRIYCLFIKMELCGKNLREWTQIECSSRKPTNFEFRYSISNQLVHGLNYIHRQDIVHRDLRPDNVFFDKSCDHDFPTKIKIGDFGLSNLLQGYESLTMTKHTGSNSLYRAPEMDTPHKNGANYGKAVDLFALGLILSEIFDAERLESLQKKFNEIKYLRNTGVTVQKTPWLDSLVLQLTDNEDKKRFFRNANGDILPISLRSTNLADPNKVARREGIDSGITIDDMTSNRNLTAPVGQALQLNEETNRVFETKKSDNSPIPSRSENLNVFKSIQHNSKMLSPLSFTDTSQGQEDWKDMSLVPLQFNEFTNSLQQTQSIITESDILSIRKLLNKDKTFWTPTNVAKFINSFGVVNPNPEAARQLTAKFLFNSNMSNLVRNHSELVTWQRICAILDAMHFPNLSDDVRRLFGK